jgi:type I restriction enzyme R subunit
MNLHKEIHLETEICRHLAENGWLYAEGDASGYDREKSFFSEDAVTWVQETQPKAWETLSKNHGAKAGEVMLTRLREAMNQLGTLEVLRRGVEMIGLRQPLSFAQFKPALAINPEIMTKYKANRLRVIRQVRYSLHNENSIDLVLFINGIPAATVELKTDFTQSINDAVDQYRFDRNPKTRSQGAETLLTFPVGALVHFAVSNSEVYMTTHLKGTETTFLPFNKGDNGGAGNPPNPNGHRTSYLWEDVWSRESWLEILGRYMVSKRNSKKQIEQIIFPRFHQLDATRKLQASVLAEGAGGRYLIQHSAGSGKTNSIAWSAHFLADLHDGEHKKLFDTVVVVSDRNVIDSQLQEAIFDFERTSGVVASIKGESSSKSGELARALSGDKKIVVCTIQTFPFALKAVRDLAATEGKRFAVIADEAHSSQTGESAAKLKELLSAEELQELNDGGEVSSEDILAAQMASRADNTGITFVAFTATPKAKTMQLFGRCPDPHLPAGKDNLPEPFHVYSMRQAIEEKFILDVLQNYTPYKLAFKLANNGKEWDETEVEKSTAIKGIMRWVRLHPYNISQKVQIVVEHYRENVAPLLNGQAKAMVVVGSRLEAVRWQIAIDKYIKSQGYRISSLVAFSGEVSDSESGTDPFTENSKILNPNLRGRDIKEAFKTEEYQILLVANKFQTGFDQPYLCGMYVDKKLGGIQAVQTLSRLNRAHPGKDTTYILDFVNDTEDILEAFKTYYTTAELADVTDPNLVLKLKAKLDAAGYYDKFEVNRVVEVELNPNAIQGDLVSALEPVVDRLLKQYKAALERFKIADSKQDKEEAKKAKEEMDALILFKRDIGSYQRMYSFLSQIFDYGNTDVEKNYIFYKRLLPLLEFGREREGIDLSKVKLTHHNLKDLGKKNLGLNPDDKPLLDPMTESGSGSVHEPDKEYLSAIIEKVNELFEGDLTDNDKLVYVNNVIKGKLLESDLLQQQAANNTKEQFSNSPDLSKAILNAVMDALDAHNIMSKQVLDSEAARNGLKNILLEQAHLYESLRSRVSDVKISI